MQWQCGIRALDYSCVLKPVTWCELDRGAQMMISKVLVLHVGTDAGLVFRFKL